MSIYPHLATPGTKLPVYSSIVMLLEYVYMYLLASYRQLWFDAQFQKNNQ